MNSLNKTLKECTEKLENQYGKLRNFIQLDSSWNNNNRLPPILMQFNNNQLVLHQAEKTDNLKKFSNLLDKKNNPEIITTSVVYIDTKFFVTNYIQGVVLDTKKSLATIVDLAKLQYNFNNYDENSDMSFWLEQLDVATNFLYTRDLIKKSKLPYLEFQHYGLIHGDFDRKNIVHSSGKNILIDIEHVMYGPLAYDLSRPLKRICKTEEERHTYLQTYNNKINLSKEELLNGNIAFYLIQAFNRANWGYISEAFESIKNLELELVNKK